MELAAMRPLERPKQRLRTWAQDRRNRSAKAPLGVREAALTRPATSDRPRTARRESLAAVPTLNEQLRGRARVADEQTNDIETDHSGGQPGGRGHHRPSRETLTRENDRWRIILSRGTHQRQVGGETAMQLVFLVGLQAVLCLMLAGPSPSLAGGSQPVGRAARASSQSQARRSALLDNTQATDVTQSEREWQDIKAQLAASLNDTLTLDLNVGAPDARDSGDADDNADLAGELASRPSEESAGGLTEVGPVPRLGEPGASIGGRSNQLGLQQVRGADRVQSLLVRQLSRLVMNERPELVENAIERETGQRVSGGLQQVTAAGRPRRALDEGPGPEEAGQFAGETSELMNAGSGDDNQPGETGDEGSSESPLAPWSSNETAVSCPDDMEPATVEVAAPASGTNLTAEQQEQLLNNSAGPLRLQHTCVPHPFVQPSQTIELITTVITPILFSIIIVVGLLGNIIVMVVILEDRKTERELTPANLLILDLSLADLSFIMFCIPFTGWDYAVGHWVFGEIWCKCNQYLIVVCALSSIYTLVLMSIDRFLAIVYPIECMSYRTSRNMMHAIYIKWILILIIALPTIRIHGLILSPDGDTYNCRFLSHEYNPLQFQIVFFVTSYLSPLVLIFCLYLSLLNKLWFGNKPHGHKESLKMLESKKKVTWLVASIVIVFALCWCPIQVMLILMRLKTYSISATYIAIQVFAHTLGYTNSCINPIVYAFASETFNQSFKRSWFARTFWRNFQACCCCCTSCCVPLPPGAPPTTGSRSMSLANAHQSIAAQNHCSTQNNNTRVSHITSIDTNSNNNTNKNNGRQLTLIDENGSRIRSAHTIGPPSGVAAGSAWSASSENNDQFDTGRALTNQPTKRAINLDKKAHSRSSPLPLEPRDRPILPPNASPADLVPPAPSSPNNLAAIPTTLTNYDHNSPEANSCEEPQLRGQPSVSSQSSGSVLSGSHTDRSSSFSEQTPVANVLCSACPQSDGKMSHQQQQHQQQQQQHQQQHKQQLVARMISGSQQAVAHDCEPCNADASGART